MLDQTMLAPGPAGTSMIGERSVDSAARRGLERQARDHEREEKDPFSDEFDNGIFDAEATHSAGVGDTTQTTQMQMQTTPQEQIQPVFQNESAENDYSDGPIHSRPEKGKGRGFWGKIAKRFRGN